MRPAVVVLGFVLGSAAAITFALAGTSVVFLLLKGQYPRLAAEFGELLLNVGLFAVLTGASAASFYAEIKRTPWRRTALVGLVLALAVIALYHALR